MDRLHGLLLARRARWYHYAALALLILSILLAYFPATGRRMIPQVKAQTYKVLVFSKTAGFRHDAIAVGTQAIRDLGAANGFSVTATEDATQFNDTNLAQYAAVIWLLTTGDVLDATQQAAFERFIRAGKGYVGIHSASDTEYTWPWYGELVGAYFASHPAIQPVRVRLDDTTHPSMVGLPNPWNRTDELYNYQTNPRSKVHVLANYDETSYTGGSMGADHPISWCRNYDGGRTWYTGMGHTQDSYTTETNFRNHILGGIKWAAGKVAGNCTPPVQQPTATIAPGCTTNVALNRAATSSSNENAGTTPNLAFDGNATTRWSSLAADPQWVQVDLGVTRNICRVRLNWEAAYGRSYQIQVSGGSTGPWTTIYTTTTGDGGIDDLSLAGSGRYVRMNGTARATAYGYSLWEFEVYGS
jgi:type 1 glutamine amidotransferase